MGRLHGRCPEGVGLVELRSTDWRSGEAVRKYGVMRNCLWIGLMDDFGKLIAAGALAGLLGFVVGACAPDQPSEAPDTGTRMRDSTGVVIVESSGPRWGPDTAWRLEQEPTLSIGVVDGLPEYQFTSVRDAKFVEEMLVVTDGRTGEVRYYDSQGQHLGSIGGTGAGPGEFGTTASMQLCALGDGSVAVTDDVRGRFHVASRSREFVSTVSLPSGSGGRPLWPRGCLFGGSWIVQGKTHRRTDGPATYSSHSIHLVEEGGRVTEELLRLNGYTTWWNATREEDILVPFSTRDEVVSSGLEVVVVRTTEGQLEWWTREGRLTRIARRMDGSRVTTASQIDEVAQSSIEAASSAEARRAWSNFFDEDLPLAEFVPMYQHAHTDPHGNVWAQRYRVPEETADQRDVFGPDGVWLGVVAMPPGLLVEDIGSDYILGMERDSLDVQMVRLYRIAKPDGDM